MPVLENPQHEAYAQGLARGTPKKQAYVEAGYKPGNKAGRLARDPRIQARVAEFLEPPPWSQSTDVRPIIDALQKAFLTATSLKSGAAFAAARGLAMEAVRLKQLLPTEDPEGGRSRRLESLTEAEWIKLYGAPAPGSRP